MIIDGKFSERLKSLCNDWYELYCDVPPIPVASDARMNTLLRGTRKPTIEELLAISEAYGVSINYLLCGDELFPSLHELADKDAKKVLDMIEDMKPEID